MMPQSHEVHVHFENIFEVLTKIQTSTQLLNSIQRQPGNLLVLAHFLANASKVLIRL